ncbi:MAG TPA: NAD(+)/NADH kinase [Thermodesulfovibrionia bacterium]|nr:NAD(+)/NADH kinase [Thermodesulfovibrionia bacterium]
MEIKKKIYLVNPEHIQDDEVIRYICNNTEIVGNPAEGELIVVAGGDGAMLKAIRAYRDLELPFTGFNYGHIGFLMNKASLQTVREIFHDNMEIIVVKMLHADLYNRQGQYLSCECAFNDFYFERTTPQAAKIRITVNDKVRFDPLIGDGVLVCTSAGSTAYNASAGGIILPIGTNSMVLTGICPAVFQHWRTTQLSADALVTLEPVDMEKRPVQFVADGIVNDKVGIAKIKYSDKIVKVAFAQSQNFHEKVLQLQFEKLKV